MSNNNHTKELSLKEKRRIQNKLSYQKNRDELLKTAKEYYKANKETIIARQRAIAPEIHRERAKKYYKQNRDAVIIKMVDRARKKRQTDPYYKLIDALRSRVNSAIRTQKAAKSLRTVELLGCSVEHARQHLESLFHEGMNWDNHKPDGWHIDHIKPVSSFDLTDPEQQKQCFHYTNLQPLWAKDNLTKNARLDWKDQSSALQQDPQ
jgi:cobalamin biosynthesis Mg chelatase CobN